jgi:hypothetical protein
MRVLCPPASTTPTVLVLQRHLVIGRLPSAQELRGVDGFDRVYNSLAANRDFTGCFSASVAAARASLPLKIDRPWSSRRSRGEGDGVAELFEALDVAALEPVGIQPIKVVGAQVGIGLVLTQHVVEDHQPGLRHRQGGPPLAPAARDPVLERG